LKRLFIFPVTITMFTLSALAQTSAPSQTGAGASTDTSVTAGHNGVNAQSNASANSQNTNASFAAGTTLNAVLTKSVDSRKAKEGDEVVAKTTSELKAPGQREIPKGTKLIGHVTKSTAKSKGDSDSTLGVIFDRAEVAKGREVPVHAVIQALAASSNNSSMAMNEDQLPDSTPRANSGGGLGGAVSGVGKTVDNTTGAVAGGAQQTGAGALGSASGTVNNTTGALGGTATSTLNAKSRGVVGLPGYTLDTAAATATQGSVITSSGKNVKLDSGTQMVLRITGE
jgi:hypothetical protein